MGTCSVHAAIRLFSEIQLPISMSSVFFRLDWLRFERIVALPHTTKGNISNDCVIFAIAGRLLVTE